MAEMSPEERRVRSEQGFYGQYRLHQYIEGSTAEQLEPLMQNAVKTAKKERREPEYKPYLEMRTRHAKRLTVPRVVASAALVFTLVGGVIYEKVQLDQLQNQISKENQIYTEYVNENVRMKAELQSRMTVKNVEEYAENELGLQQLNQSQIEYVQIQESDVVALAEEETDIFVRIKNKFISIIEYLQG